jgi:hypothetical protein
MEIHDSELTPLQGLQMITEVISKTKDNLREHSYCFLLWGWLIAAASFLFFALHEYTSFSLYFLPFPILAAAGIFLTLRFYAGRRHAPETYLSYYLKRMWLVLGLGFVLVVVINVIGQDPPFTYTLLIAGIGTLVSGLVLRFRPLVFGGILFLLCSIASVVTPDRYKPLLQGIAVLFGYLIPGYRLKRSSL